jgi:hypothetical protein
MKIAVMSMRYLLLASLLCLGGLNAQDVDIDALVNIQQAYKQRYDALQLKKEFQLDDYEKLGEKEEFYLRYIGGLHSQIEQERKTRPFFYYLTNFLNNNSLRMQLRISRDRLDQTIKKRRKMRATIDNTMLTP